MHGEGKAIEMSKYEYNLLASVNHDRQRDRQTGGFANTTIDVLCLSVYRLVCLFLGAFRRLFKPLCRYHFAFRAVAPKAGVVG